MKKFVKEITKKSDQIEIEGLTQCLYQLIQQTWNPEQHINNSYNYNFDQLDTLAHIGNLDAQLQLGLYWLACAASNGYPPVIRAIGAWYQALKKNPSMECEKYYGEMLQEMANKCAEAQNIDKASILQLMADQYLCMRDIEDYKNK